MGKILIIDDDPVFTSLLLSYIHEICPLLKVEICNNPIAALALIKKGDNELVLIDREMPSRNARTKGLVRDTIAGARVKHLRLSRSWIWRISARISPMS